MPRKLISVVACSLAVALCAMVVNAEVAGKKKKGLKGRYWTWEDGVDLERYKGALLILEAAEISADKDHAVDTESVRATSDEMLRAELARLGGFFNDIVSMAPLQLPEGLPVLRMSTHITLQYGSQAMRYWVGAGAGRSKLHIRIDLTDALTGKQLGSFNGYGSGSGMWSISGGGIQRMARDDLQENYMVLVDLFAEQI